MLSRFLYRFVCRFARPNVKPVIDNDKEWLSWLEDLKSQKVHEYIKKENRYTKLQLLAAWRVQRQIQKRIEQLEAIQDQCTHSIENEEKIDPYIYYQKPTDDGLPSVYRRHVSVGDEVLVFDQNEMGKETGFIQMLGLKISSCSKYLAAVVKTRISDASCTCFVYKLTQYGPVLVEKLPNVKNAEWSSSSKTLLVTSCDDFGVPRKVEGFCIQERRLYSLLEEKDPRFQIDILKSRDSKLIIAHSTSKSCSEVYFMDANRPERGFHCLLKREDGCECFVDHWDNHLYALKNDRTHVDYMISTASIDGSIHSWRTMYSPDKQKFILDMEILAGCIVACELNTLVPQLTFIPMDNNEDTRTVQVSNYPSIVESFSNQNPYCEAVRIAISSPISPLQVLEINRSNLETIQLSKSPSTWDPKDFDYQVVEAISQDGTIVPTTIYYRKKLDLQNAPLFATVYGAYGIPVDLRFSATSAFLLENGWILAFPHVRGGGEFGRSWYKQATKDGKRKTFQDLGASLYSLHKSGISQPSKTAVYGVSAGGLAAAVICNELPELIQAAVLQVPFLDVLNSMVKGSSYLTEQEYEEWGNPANSKDDYDTIESYCPLHNLKQIKNFPSIYIKTYADDERVPAWMPLKFVAKLRSLEMNHPKTNNLVLCRIDASGGHYGYNNQGSKSVSEMITFLYKSLDLHLSL